MKISRLFTVYSPFSASSVKPLLCRKEPQLITFLMIKDTPRGYIGGLSTALQNAVDKTLMPGLFGSTTSESYDVGVQDAKKFYKSQEIQPSLNKKGPGQVNGFYHPGMKNGHCNGLEQTVTTSDTEIEN
ncbi:unnamed protein product [Ranitomeya imitator]|uniref:Uncharacterized protein n=1 Tax=Ranitomeya imitator TaxID=111125 RepID=A0ABN9LNJ4_9NEOB|nr:unnamed protein product [Ranitomeya imitator]